MTNAAIYFYEVLEIFYMPIITPAASLESSLLSFIYCNLDLMT